jgi:MFS family permease
MTEIETTLAMEAEFAKTTSYLDMVKTKGNRWRLFISVSLGIYAQWNGVGVVSYYLAAVLETVGITSVTQQTLINGFLQLFNLIVAVTAAGLVDRLGRRFLFMTSSIGMLVCYIIVTGLSGSFAHTGAAGTGIAVIPMLFLYYGFYDIAFTPFVVSYPAEIWPYNLRSRGIAVTLCSTFIALFFNLFVNPIALQSIAWKYYIVYVAILIGICFTCWFLYPETRGYSLEEMAVIFDGENAAVPKESQVAEAVEKQLQQKRGSFVEHQEDVDRKA